jgi:hypothetical protein
MVLHTTGPLTQQGQQRMLSAGPHLACCIMSATNSKVTTPELEALGQGKLQLHYASCSP